MLLKCLQKELSEYADVSVEIREEGFINSYAEKLETQFSISKYCQEYEKTAPDTQVHRQKAVHLDKSKTV